MVKNHITIDDLLGLKQVLLDDLQEIIRRLRQTTPPCCLKLAAPLPGEAQHRREGEPLKPGGKKTPFKKGGGR